MVSFGASAAKSACSAVGVAVLRIVVLLNSVGINLYRFDTFRSPAVGVAAIAALVLWTAVAIWAYAEERRRTAPLLIGDLAVACGLILVSPVLKGDELRATVPGFMDVFESFDGFNPEKAEEAARVL